MKATRRKVLGWLLAATIMPPRLELAVDPTGNPVDVMLELLEHGGNPWPSFEQHILNELREWCNEQVVEHYAIPTNLIRR